MLCSGRVEGSRIGLPTLIYQTDGGSFENLFESKYSAATKEAAAFAVQKTSVSCFP